MKTKTFPQSVCVGNVSLVKVTSPIGDIDIHSCPDGLHLVKQCEADDKHFSPDESVPVKMLEFNKLTSPAEECIKWLKDYFNNGVAKPEIPPLCSAIVNEGTFRCQAWKILPGSVPFGTTITYLKLASLCGSPKACQAAGSAMSNNPISLLIPCHRVIPSNGSVGNYSHGKKNSIKAWLLDFEKRCGIFTVHAGFKHGHREEA